MLPKIRDLVDCDDIGWSNNGTLLEEGGVDASRIRDLVECDDVGWSNDDTLLEEGGAGVWRIRDQETNRLQWNYLCRHQKVAWTRQFFLFNN